MFRVSNPARAPRRKGFVSGLALAFALTAAGAGFAVPAQAQSDAPQYSKNFAKVAQKASEDLNAARNKPEIVAEINNLVAATNALQAAKGDAVAPARAQLDAIGKRIQGMTTAEHQEIEGLVGQAQGADDKYFAGELMTFLGAFSGDRDLRARGLKLKLDSGTLKPEAIAPAWFELGQLYSGTNRADDAHGAFDAAYKAGNMDGAIFAADTFFTSNRVAEGLDYLEGLIVARTVAGLDVPQTWYGSGLSHARDLGDAGRTGHWAALYAVHGNTPQSWNAGIAVLLENAKYENEEQLDAYRLMQRTGGLVTEGSYIAYLRAAYGDKGGVAYPGEVVKIATAAEKSGTVVSNGSFVESSLRTAENLIENDRASLPDLAADGRKATAGAGALEAGDAYLSYDLAPEAEEMFTLALTKGGVDNDRALTRLAIAQADQGKYAEARANLAKVGGARAPLAALWMAYVDTKAGRRS